MPALALQFSKALREEGILAAWCRCVDDAASAIASGVDVLLVDAQGANVAASVLALAQRAGDDLDVPVVVAGAELDDAAVAELFELGIADILGSSAGAAECAARVRVAVRRHRQNLDLRTSSLTDDLTGLTNRRGLYLAFERERQRSLRAREPLALVALDLDHFKGVNDTHGHVSGDHLLSQIGRVLTQDLRATDVAARVGGEEFLVLLPGGDAASAPLVAEKLRERIQTVEIVAAQGGRARVTASVGTVVAAPEDLLPASALERLRVRADEALYRAKRAGGNRVIAALAMTPTGGAPA